MTESLDLPTDPAERAVTLQELLVNHATGGKENNAVYVVLRREFMETGCHTRFVAEFRAVMPQPRRVLGLDQVAGRPVGAEAGID